MGIILDYDQMIEKLHSFNNKIKKEKSIGNTKFNYEIEHYTYGHGKEHVIIVGGTHAMELISAHFVLELMEKLENEKIKLNEEKYTIHFIPILNPEGTIIVTSAIRTLIDKNISNELEQEICNQYYLNAKLDDYYVEKDNNKNEKLHHLMFQKATYQCISDKHEKLKENIKEIVEKYNLPIGSLIDWANNGNGIDLNSNVETGKYFEEKKKNQSVYMHLRFNTLDMMKPGPIGCPYLKDEFEYELENKALLKFYEELVKKQTVIGSLIYHACGGLVYYLEEQEKQNPWNPEYDAYQYNREVAKIYAQISNYKIIKSNGYTTLDTKLMTILSGTLLVELSTIRANPLSQFLELEKDKYSYSKTININIASLKETINKMSELYNERMIKDERAN